MNTNAYDDSHTDKTRFNLNRSWLLFSQSGSQISFIYGYAILLAVLFLCQLPWIGGLLGLVAESIVAGYYLRIMAHEIHEEEQDFAIWPKISASELLPLMRLGLWTNIIQVYFALVALVVPLILAGVFSLVCFGAVIVSIDQYGRLFFSANVVAWPLSVWSVTILAPASLARYAHSNNIRDCLNVVLIHRSTDWDSRFIKGAAGIYCFAIAVNVSMALFAPFMTPVFEPLIEFCSMAFVCRLNGRWYRLFHKKPTII